METKYKPNSEEYNLSPAVMSLDLDKGVEGVLGEELSVFAGCQGSSCRAACRGGCRGCLSCRRCKNDLGQELTDAEIDSLVYETLN